MHAFAPTGFFVHGGLRKPPQGMNRSSISLHRRRRQQRAWRLIHKRHELVGETRHGASNTDSTHIRTTTDAAHPTPLADVALHHGSPASQLNDAKRRAIFFGKLRLLVEAAAVTAF